MAFPPPKRRIVKSSSESGCMACDADIEEGLGGDAPEMEAERPVRWNQPAVVIIACCIILGVLGSGIGYAIR